MNTTETPKIHLFLTRGIVAIAWAAVFAAASNSLTAPGSFSSCIR